MKARGGSVGGTMYFIQFDGFQSVLQGTPEFSLLYRWSHQRKEVRAVIPRLIPPSFPRTPLCLFGFHVRILIKLILTNSRETSDIVQLLPFRLEDKEHQKVPGPAKASEIHREAKCRTILGVPHLIFSHWSFWLEI